MNRFIYAARSLRKNMSFAISVILLLALGIGGTVSIFSVVNAVLLRPLPYANSDRLVLLFGNVQRTAVERRGASLPDYRDWKEQNHSFDGLASFWNRMFAMKSPEERVPLEGEVVGSRYFDLLGIQPVLGRSFREDEETSSRSPVVVISHDFWTQRMSSNPEVLGKELTLNSGTYTIVGVMPAGFRGLRDGAQVWVPAASLPDDEQDFRDRGSRGLNVLGRLRAGVTLAQAQADMDAVSHALERAYPDTNEKRGVELSPLVQETFGTVRPALLVLLGAVGLVLLVACANVANLMVLRTEKRHAEIAIRAAIGASRKELLKVMLAESLLLAFMGAGLGLLVSGWAVDLVLAVSPIQLPTFVNVGLDRNVVIFATGLAILTSIVMAIAPVLQLAPSQLQEALSSNTTRTVGTRSTRRFRSALIVVEVALSFVLLLTAGLLIGSFRQLMRVDTGFVPSNLLAVRVAFEEEGSTKALAVKDALEHLPGVSSVALTSVIPFTGGGAVFYSAEGADPIRDPSTAPRAYLNFVSPGFFRTMGIAVRHGREFESTESEQSAIVSEKLAERFWPGQDPIGKRIRIGRNNSQNPWMNIVGVVGNSKTRDIPENPTADPDIYFTYSMFGGNPGMIIRTEVDPSSLIPTVMNEIKRADKFVVVNNINTVEGLMRPRTARARFLSSLSGTFSALALILALVGIYGSMSYNVAQRTREIGIRIALGANHGDLVRMVLRWSLALISCGLVLGLVGSFFAGQGIARLLYGVSPTAPAVFLATAVLMMVTGLGAAYLPARRATMVDPLNALRQE